MMPALAAAALAAADGELGLIDRRIAADRAAIARAEAPLLRLLAGLRTLPLQGEARRRGAALAGAMGPAVAATTRSARHDLQELAARRAELAVRLALRQRGLPIVRRPHVAPVPRCDGAWRAPVAGSAATPGAAAALGRPRGLTLVALPQALVVAPAAGRVAYAGRFRRYGGVVIVDHGHGWTTLLTGLARVSAETDGHVAAGDPVGEAASRDPFVTVELSRRGRPVDPLAMLRRCPRRPSAATPFPPAARAPT